MKVNVTTGAGFTGAVSYVSQKKGAEFVGSNMLADSPKDMPSEFGMTRTFYDGRGEKPVFHASLSPAPGEQIDNDQAHQLARDYMKKMGMDPEQHQYALWRHTDTGHDHFHLICNRISADGQKFWNDSWSHKRSIEASQQLEKEHGLVRTPGLEGGKKAGQQLDKSEKEQVQRLGLEEHPKETLRRGIDQAIQSSDGSRQSFTDELRKKGIEAHWSQTKRSGHIRGASFELKNGPEGISNKYTGGKLGKDYAWPQLKQTLANRANQFEQQKENKSVFDQIKSAHDKASQPNLIETGKVVDLERGGLAVRKEDRGASILDGLKSKIKIKIKNKKRKTKTKDNEHDQGGLGF